MNCIVTSYFLHCAFNFFSYSTKLVKLITVYGKIFEWENFCGWYANDHSQENFCSGTTVSCRILRETYRITYSIKIHWKYLRLNAKLRKFPHSKILPYMVCLAQYNMQSTCLGRRIIKMDHHHLPINCGK